MDILKLSTDLQSELIRKLNSKSTLTEMLTQIVNRVGGNLKAGACTIYIIDPSGDTATQRAGTGYQQQFVDQAQCKVLTAHLVIDKPKTEEKLGLTGWILSTGKSFLAETPDELVEHPHQTGKHDPIQLPNEELSLQTFLGVPLRGLRGEVIGLIKAERREAQDDSEPVEPFSINDQIALETAARVASKTVAYVETAQNGQADDAITAWTRDVITESAATEGELDSFLDVVVSVMASAMSSDSCGIYLIDESKKTLTQRAGIRSQAFQIVIRSYKLPTLEDIEIGEERVGLTAWIAATGQPFYAPNFDRMKEHPHHRGQYDEQNFPEETKTICGAFLGAPLQIGGTTIGVIKVENISLRNQPDDRVFPEEAQRRFDVLAQDIALAIMRLQEQRRSRYRVISDAQPTILEILRGGLSVRDLVEKVVNETANLFHAEACALFIKEGNRLIQPQWAAYGWALRGPKIRDYELVESSQIKDDPGENEKVGLTVWIAVKQEKFTARSNLELTMHPHHRGIYDKVNFYPGQTCQSFMGVPLLVEDRLVGVLKVETKTREVEPGRPEYTYFSEQDELVFDLIANSAAIAIENAKLLESQRLAEQIRSQPNRLLLDMHEFIKGNPQAFETLNQVVDLLQGKSPIIASIIKNFAALLQPDLRFEMLGAIPTLLKEHGEFIDGSHAARILYKSFTQAYDVDSLNKIFTISSSFEHLAEPELFEPQFYLSEAALVLVTMYRNIAENLQPDSARITRGSRVVIVSQLNQTLEETQKLAQPEQDIIYWIAEKWLKIVEEAEEEFRVIANPYVAGLPIDPEKDGPFFGRQDIFKWVGDNLRGATQKNILVLHGQRRMGKTSILLQLERGKHGHPLRERDSYPLIPVFISLQMLAEEGTSSFLSEIANIAHQKISDLMIVDDHLKLPAEEEFKQAPFETFKQLFKQINASLEGSLLVVMLDEFEKLDDLVNTGKVDRDIYGFLRDQMQFLENITFILAGTHMLEELSDDYRGIVFTVALHREVGYMSEKDAKDLIQKPVAGKVKYEEAAVDQLFHMTNGHPFFLQALCQNLIQKMNERKETNFVSLHDVNESINEFIDQHESFLKWIWKKSRPAEQAILKDLSSSATGGCPAVSLSELNQAPIGTDQDFSEAIQRLFRRRLIQGETIGMKDSEHTMIRMTLPLFSNWIYQHYSSLDTILSKAQSSGG